jgi:hypothetical protein
MTTNLPEMNNLDAALVDHTLQDMLEIFSDEMLAAMVFKLQAELKERQITISETKTTNI